MAGDVCWNLKGVLLAYKIQKNFTNPLAFVGDHFSGVLSCEQFLLHPLKISLIDCVVTARYMSSVITKVLMSLGFQTTELDSQMREHNLSGLFSCKTVVLRPLKVLLIVCVVTARYKLSLIHI